MIHEFNNKFEFIDKIGMFNLLIRCIELMKNTDIKPENQCHASLEIIIHILETNALHITTPPRFITILALKHDIHKLAPLLNKIQEVMIYGVRSPYDRLFCILWGSVPIRPSFLYI